MKILIAEDSVHIREQYQIMFKSLSVEMPTFAEDGKEALSLSKKEAYDIIITDIDMPNMSGIEFIAELKSQDGPSREASVIFVSSFIDQYAHQAATHGFLLLEKPLSEESIENFIKMSYQNKKKGSTAC